MQGGIRFFFWRLDNVIKKNWTLKKEIHRHAVGKETKVVIHIVPNTHWSSLNPFSAMDDNQTPSF
jgi:hypothetical protein